jgi:uncharacterized protein YndB with AHSA1/START domain
MIPSASRQVHELFIQTTASKLWETLTSSELTPHYFFGTAVKSSFEPGAPIRYDLPDGTLAVDGVVLACEPQKNLVHTWRIHYDPALAEETSTVEWHIEQRGKVCRVVATHELVDAPRTAAHLGAGQDGWSVVLSGLKTYLETGKPLELPLPG